MVSARSLAQAPSHTNKNGTDPRGNTRLARLETLVIVLNGWSQVYDSSGLVRLLDSIPSPVLLRVTFVVGRLCNDYHVKWLD
jgi:hypothetical protein